MQDLGFPSATAISSQNRFRSYPEYSKMRWSPETMHMQDQNHMESAYLPLPFFRQSYRVPRRRGSTHFLISAYLDCITNYTHHILPQHFQPKILVKTPNNHPINKHALNSPPPHILHRRNQQRQSHTFTPRSLIHTHTANQTRLLLRRRQWQICEIITKRRRIANTLVSNRVELQLRRRMRP